MVVFSGASDKTIFENAQQNYAFRAWHDLTHLRLMAPFTPEGEARVAEAQISDLRKFYGDTPQTRHMAGAIRAEINGQVQYSLAHGGDFPVDQRAFDAAWLRNPDQAVQMVFKLAAKYHWGRLRDKAAGMQHHEFKPSDLAIKVSVELQAAHHRAHVVKLYNPDEPRDERGRWTFGAVSAEEFVAARDKSSRIGYLSPLKPGDLTGYKLFANSNRTVGVAVSPTGDIQNVFNNGGPKGAGTNAVKWAIANGGTTLDCYAGFLPMYYSKLGFGETGRVKFDPQYAPSGWNYAEQDSPDVVFMKLR